jgi:hypothetical protein
MRIESPGRGRVRILGAQPECSGLGTRKVALEGTGFLFLKGGCVPLDFTGAGKQEDKPQCLGWNPAHTRSSANAGQSSGRGAERGRPGQKWAQAVGRLGRRAWGCWIRLPGGARPCWRPSAQAVRGPGTLGWPERTSPDGPFCHAQGGVPTSQRIPRPCTKPRASLGPLIQGGRELTKRDFSPPRSLGGVG